MLIRALLFFYEKQKADSEVLAFVGPNYIVVPYVEKDTTIHESKDDAQEVPGGKEKTVEHSGDQVEAEKGKKKQKKRKKRRTTKTRMPIRCGKSLVSTRRLTRHSSIHTLTLKKSS